MSLFVEDCGWEWLQAAATYSEKREKLIRDFFFLMFENLRTEILISCLIKTGLKIDHLTHF